MNTTATGISMQRDMRFDLRRRRADQVLAMIMHELGDLVEDRREAHYRLFKLFTDEGVEILTDYTRSEIGLPPRDEMGWTRHEFLAYERARVEMMLRPIKMMAPLDSE